MKPRKVLKKSAIDHLIASLACVCIIMIIVTNMLFRPSQLSTPGLSQSHAQTQVHAHMENQYEILFLSPLRLNWAKPYMSERRDGICKVMFVNYNMNILQRTTYLTNVSSNYNEDYGETFAKLITIYNALLSINTTHNNTGKSKLIVMMYDSFDVYFQADYESILNIYLQRNESSSILINVELNCHITWLINGEEKKACTKLLELSSQYLNTGVFIASFNVLLDFYDKLLNEFLPIFKSQFRSRNTKKMDDQAIILMYFLYLYENHLNYNIITPDENSTFIQTFHEQATQYKKNPKQHPLQFEFKTQTFNDNNYSVLYNVVTNSTPLVLHFNGHAKWLMEQYIDQSIKQNTANGMFTAWNATNFTYHTDNGDFEWDELCHHTV